MKEGLFVGEAGKFGGSFNKGETLNSRGVAGKYHEGQQQAGSQLLSLYLSATTPCVVLCSCCICFDSDSMRCLVG